MPHLIYDRVKHRMGARGYGFVTEVARDTGLEYDHLRAAITSRKAVHPINLAAIYTLAEVLRGEGEDVEDVVRDIVLSGTPDTPPEKKTRDPQGPARRQDSEKKTGPQRTTDSASAA